jgi:hypothetical protein
MALSRAGDARRGVAIGAGVLVIGIAKLSHLNENMLFLSIVLALYAWIAISARPRALVVPLAAMLPLVLVPVKVPSPAFIEPARIDDEQWWSARLPARGSWQYAFTLRDIERHVAECGAMDGHVYIDGDGLTAASVTVDVAGTTLAEPPRFVKANTLDQIQLTPRTDGVAAFSVRLTAAAGHHPSIRIGPEVQRDAVFSDAVFLEFRNANCAVLYHARRVEVAAIDALASR